MVTQEDGIQLLTQYAVEISPGSVLMSLRLKWDEAEHMHDKDVAKEMFEALVKSAYYWGEKQLLTMSLHRMMRTCFTSVNLNEAVDYGYWTVAMCKHLSAEAHKEPVSFCPEEIAIDSMSFVGSSFELLSKPNHAVEAFNEALLVLEQVKYTNFERKRLIISKKLGVLLYSMKDFHQAVDKLLPACQAQLDSLDQTVNEVSVFRKLGDSLIQVGRASDSVRFLEYGMKLANLLSDYIELQECRLCLQQAADSKLVPAPLPTDNEQNCPSSILDKVVVVLGKAGLSFPSQPEQNPSLKEEDNDVCEIWWSEMRDGALSLAGHDYSSSIEHYKKAVQLAQSLSNATKLSRSLTGQVEAMLCRGDTDEHPIKQMIQDAVDFAAASETNSVLWKAVFTHGTVFQHFHNTTEALLCYQQVVSNASKAGGSVSFALAAQVRIFEIYTAQGNAELLCESTILLKQLLQDAATFYQSVSSALFDPNLLLRLKGAESLSHILRTEFCQREIKVAVSNLEQVKISWHGSLFVQMISLLGQENYAAREACTNELYCAYLAAFNHYLVEDNTQVLKLLILITSFTYLAEYASEIRRSAQVWETLLHTTSLTIFLLEQAVCGIYYIDFFRQTYMLCLDLQCQAFIHLGAYEQAQKSLEKAENIHRFCENVWSCTPGGNSEEIILRAKQQASRAKLLHLLGMTSQALSVYKNILVQIDSLPATTTKQNIEKEVCACVVDIFNCMGDKEQAVYFQERLLKLADACVSDTPEQGNMLRKLGQLEKAFDSYTKSMSLLEEQCRGGDSVQLTQVRLNLGTLWYVRPDLVPASRAASLFQQCLQHARKIQDARKVGEYANHLGNVLNTMNEFKHAENCYEESMRSYESLYSNIAEAETRVSMFGSLFEGTSTNPMNPYLGYQSLLYKQNRMEDALVMSDQIKSRALAEVLGSFDTGESGWLALDDIKELVKKEEALALIYAGVGAEREGIYLCWLVTPDGTLFHRTLKFDHDTKDLMQNLRDSMGVRGQAIHYPEFDILEEKSAESRKLDAEEEGSRDLDNHEEVKVLSEIYAKLLGPAEHILSEYTKLVIVPAQELYNIPWAALTDSEGNYLIQKTSIQVVPSLRVWKKISDLASVSHEDVLTRALFVGNPWPLSLNAKSLDFAREEVEILSRRLEDHFSKVECLTESKATKAAVFAKSKQSAWLHFACHGLLEEQCLLLSKSESCEGQLGMPEIQGGKIGLLPGSTVFLSACNTARGCIKQEGVLGLSRAFMAAGATSVVVSLWSLYDQSAKEIMIRIYQNLIAGHTLAQALQFAMLEAAGRTLVSQAPCAGAEKTTGSDDDEEESGGRSWYNAQGLAEKQALEELFNHGQPFFLNGKPVGANNGLNDRAYVSDAACQVLFLLKKIQGPEYPQTYMSLWGKNGFIARNTDSFDTSRIRTAIGMCKCHHPQKQQGLKCTHVNCALQQPAPLRGLLRSLHKRAELNAKYASQKNNKTMQAHAHMYKQITETAEALLQILDERQVECALSSMALRGESNTKADQQATRWSRPRHWAGLTLMGLSSCLPPTKQSEEKFVPSVAATSSVNSAKGQKKFIEFKSEEAAQWLEDEAEAPDDLVALVRQQKLKGHTLARLSINDFRERFGIAQLQADQVYHEIQSKLRKDESQSDLVQS
jgi:CHAT domain-containing protein